MSDNNYFENNMEALERIYPAYYQFFRDYNFDSDNTCVVKEHNYRKILGIRYNGVFFQLESKYDNTLFCESILIDEKDWALKGKLFLFGFANGMYCRCFLDKMSEDHSIVVYEPSAHIFYTTLKNYDISDIILNKRLILYIENANNNLSYTTYLENVLEYTDVYTFRCTYCHNYESVFPAESKKWIQIVKDSLANISSNYYLYESWGKEFISNIFSNYQHIVKSKSIGSIEKTLPENVPAIVVSAGPSLSKNIHHLKNAKNHSVIIAVDAAVNPLMRNGIVPDVIVGIDPIKGEKYISEIGDEKIPLVCILNTARTLLKSHQGDKFFTNCHDQYGNDYLINEDVYLPALPNGGSVANSAFSLAVFLGAKKIVFVGQDLAYTGDKTHAEGSVRGNEGKEFIEKEVKHQIMDIDVYGNPIRTCASFRRFKIWFEDEIEYNKEIEVIDATEGGIKINGTIIMDLKDAIDKYCGVTYSPQSLFSEAADLLTDEQKIEYLNRILELNIALENNRLRILKCKHIYDDMRKLVYDGKTNSKQMKTLSIRANEMLSSIQDDKAMSYIRDIKSTEIDKILETVYYTESDVDKEILSICDIGEKYLDYMLEGMEEFVELSGDNWDIIRKTRDELVVKTGE